MVKFLNTGDPLANWDKQIRLFARYFLAHARLPLVPFSLLDAGCGTGSALEEIHKHYPQSILSGCDMEYENVRISTARNGKFGNYYCSDIMKLQIFYDIIYISNVLEHNIKWKEAVLHLLSLCNRLYILVPYLEDIKGNIICDVPNETHVSSFDKISFNFLVHSNYIVENRLIRTPYAWGHPLKREMGLRFKSIFSRKQFIVQRQLLVAISNYHDRNGILPVNPFQNIFRSSYNVIHV